MPLNAAPVSFVPYAPAYYPDCLALFDANCPGFFAPNERDDYAVFLNLAPSGYFVCQNDRKTVGAFGLIDEGVVKRLRLNWIMIHPAAQGSGAGRQMMAYIISEAKVKGVAEIDIAASHLSADFFQRFGAQRIKFTEHGWGPDMHRVDMTLCVQ